MISNDGEGNGYYYYYMINQGIPTEWGIIDELDEHTASEDAIIILG